jgi:hypothetical protein
VWGKPTKPHVPKLTRDEERRAKQNKDQFVGRLQDQCESLSDLIPGARSVTTAAVKDATTAVDSLNCFGKSLALKKESSLECQAADGETLLLLAAKAASAITNCVYDTVLTAMAANDEIIDSSKAAEILRENIVELHELLGPQVNEAEDEDLILEDNEEGGGGLFEHDDDNENYDEDDDDSNAGAGGGGGGGSVRKLFCTRKSNFIDDSGDEELCNLDAPPRSAGGTPTKKSRVDTEKSRVGVLKSRYM